MLPSRPADYAVSRPRLPLTLFLLSSALGARADCFIDKFVSSFSLPAIYDIILTFPRNCAYILFPSSLRPNILRHMIAMASSAAVSQPARASPSPSASVRSLPSFPLHLHSESLSHIHISPHPSLPSSSCRAHPPPRRAWHVSPTPPAPSKPCLRARIAKPKRVQSQLQLRLRRQRAVSQPRWRWGRRGRVAAGRAVPAAPVSAADVPRAERRVRVRLRPEPGLCSRASLSFLFLFALDISFLRSLGRPHLLHSPLGPHRTTPATTQGERPAFRDRRPSTTRHRLVCRASRRTARRAREEALETVHGLVCDSLLLHSTFCIRVVFGTDVCVRFVV